MRQAIKFRSKFSVLLLALTSFVIPGIGQLFAGRLQRGITFYILILLLSAVAIFGGLLDYLYGFCFYLVILTIFFFYLAFDTFKLNTNKNGIELKWYNKWYFYLCFIIGTLIPPAIFNFPPNINDFYRTFRIPNESSAPTLQIQDRIVAKIKSNAGYKTGSLIIFTPPDHNNKTPFIKRIVAQNGDRYLIKNAIAYLNNKIVIEPYILASNNKKSDSINFGPVTVPPGFVLVLGDNRDNSFDSRYFGFVPTKNIIGKALYIYWSHDFHKIGFRLD